MPRFQSCENDRIKDIWYSFLCLPNLMRFKSMYFFPHPSSMGCKHECWSSRWAISTIFFLEWDTCLHVFSCKLRQIATYLTYLYKFTRVVVVVQILMPCQQLRQEQSYSIRYTRVYKRESRFVREHISQVCHSYLLLKFLFFTAFSRSGTTVS